MRDRRLIDSCNIGGSGMLECFHEARFAFVGGCHMQGLFFVPYEKWGGGNDICRATESGIKEAGSHLFFLPPQARWISRVRDLVVVVAPAAIVLCIGLHSQGKCRGLFQARSCS